MPPKIPFALAENTPGLILQIEARKDSSLRLLVAEASDSALPYLETAAEESLVGRDVTEFFVHQRRIVDEWMKYIVKWRRKVSSQTVINRKETDFICEYLEYFHHMRNWMMVTLTCSWDCRYAMVSLAPEPAPRAGPLDQLKYLRHTQWLTDDLFDGGYWELNIQTQDVFLSRKLAALLKLGQDAVIIPLAQFMNLVFREDRFAVMYALDHVDSNPTNVFNRGLLNDGSKVCFLSNGIPIYDKDGRMIIIYGCSKNNTGAPECIDAPSLCDRRFAAMTENTSALFLITDNQGRYIYLSPGTEQILGTHTQEVMGKRFDVFLARKEDVRTVGRKMRSILREVGAAELDCLLRVADGHPRWYHMEIATVADADGNVTEAIAVGRDVTELFRLREKLEYEATHDKLTGLYNRHYFWQEMHRLDHNGTVGLCLVLVDVNGLKRVNDTFGNQKGDEMLTEVAEILGRVFEGAHVIARMDGSQFAILVTGTDLLQVEGLCAKLDGMCGKTKWRMLPLSISWGIGHRRDTNITMPALFKLAEDRVYSQKLLIDQSHHSRMLTSLKETLKFCNLETADHMYRMENMVQALGKHLRLTTAEFNRLVLLAGMHDIGKVAIPDSIINKPARLDEIEWLTMRTHSEVGYRIAMASQELSNIAMEIYHHHERWDGGGYPAGIAGESIPFLSRIISVVDTYEVMTHRRVYKEPVGHQDAIAELHRCAGTQFDPHVVELFLEVFGNLTPDEMERFTRDVPAACETDNRECSLLP